MDAVRTDAADDAVIDVAENDVAGGVPGESVDGGDGDAVRGDAGADYASHVGINEELGSRGEDREED